MAPGHLGVLGTHLQGDECAVGREGGGHGHGRVAGERPDLDDPAGAGDGDESAEEGAFEFAGEHAGAGLELLAGLVGDGP